MLCFFLCSFCFFVCMQNCFYFKACQKLSTLENHWTDEKQTSNYVSIGKQMRIFYYAQLSFFLSMKIRECHTRVSHFVFYLVLFLYQNWQRYQLGKVFILDINVCKILSIFLTVVCENAKSCTYKHKQKQKMIKNMTKRVCSYQCSLNVKSVSI